MKKSILFLLIFLSAHAFANNMLVQNVITTDNDPVNKTIQVQFDISWDNSWRDSINYDAAWIFIKFKDAGGLWRHAQLNQTGFNLGAGTADSIKVTSDKVGSWVYRSGLGSGTFSVTGMQLQWNYGLSGLTSVTGLEVRVFAVEMIYVPAGGFTINTIFQNYITSPYGTNQSQMTLNAPGSNYSVINQRISPTLMYSDNYFDPTTTMFSSTNLAVKIKGDAGIDTNNDGIIDNSTYPTGYKAFYSFKYELTDQQYADFLNTLTTSQKTGIGVAGTSISLNNGQYFSSAPNRACGNSNADRLFAIADWACLRPISFLEFSKAAHGPLQPSVFANSIPTFPNTSLTNVGSNATSTTNRVNAISTYYGHMDFSGNAKEPIVNIKSFAFNDSNGDGSLQSNGKSDIAIWLNSTISFIEPFLLSWGGSDESSSSFGFRYARTAE
jgi:hypothetical protein